MSSVVLAKKSNKVMLLARFFLQRIMFIKFISTLQECLKKYETLTAYIPLFVVNLPLKVKIDMHIEQCNVVVIIMYEIRKYENP